VVNVEFGCWCKCKRNVTIVLTSAPRHEGERTRGGRPTAPCIHNLCIRWISLLAFTPAASPPRKELLVSVGEEAEWTPGPLQTRWRRDLWSCRDFNSGCLARSLVTILTELSWFANRNKNLLWRCAKDMKCFYTTGLIRETRNTDGFIHSQLQTTRRKEHCRTVSLTYINKTIRAPNEC
jgi:hypothetical protein